MIIEDSGYTVECCKPFCPGRLIRIELDLGELHLVSLGTAANELRKLNYVRSLTSVSTSSESPLLQTRRFVSFPRIDTRSTQSDALPGRVGRILRDYDDAIPSSMNSLR